ncbi:MAG: hypothetical protein K9G05_00750 [Candidatus Nanopelagicales bacterium]|nr:hypothetical protein [Candidatus Nanopelagicales bacterium]
MPNLSILDHPLAALLVGAFAAVILMGLLRRLWRISLVGVIGLTVTLGILIWQMST